MYHDNCRLPDRSNSSCEQLSRHQGGHGERHQDPGQPSGSAPVLRHIHRADHRGLSHFDIHLRVLPLGLYAVFHNAAARLGHNRFIISSVIHMSCMYVYMFINGCGAAVNAVKQFHSNNLSQLDQETAKMHLPFGLLLVVGVLITPSGLL